MGNICNTVPTQPRFDLTKYKRSSLTNSQLNKTPSIEHIIEQRKKNQPNSSFAQAIRFAQLPQITVAAKKRLEQLGPYTYDQFEKNHTNSGEKLLTPYQLSNKVCYDGQWKDGQMHGRGRYYLPGGSLLQTESKHGKIQGKGRIIFFDGSYFEGELKGSAANGKGKYVKQNTKYQGDFLNNLQHGYGQQQGPGYNFKGRFQNGMRKHGTLVYGQQEKFCYQGQIQNNEPHGRGKLSNNVGVYQGQFQYGVKSGKGQFTWKDGHIFKGHYEKDLKNGQGELYNPAGTKVRQGVWKNDAYIH